MLAYADCREWAWWKVPVLLRAYVAVVVLGALGVACFAASQTGWTAADGGKFALLLACGMVSIAATPRIAYSQGVLVRDFVTAWVLPIAILLPPVYAMVTPAPIYILTQLRVHKGIVYRRVFTAAAIGMAYGAASLLFRAFPQSFAGHSIGTGMHAVTWTIAVCACELVGGRGHRFLIIGGIKLSDLKAHVVLQEFNREALQDDFAEFHLGVLITVVVAVSPILAIFAVPTVLLIRRFLMHQQLLAKSRIDTKTGLLNSSTWEGEAATQVQRARRTDTPLSVALIDIDHFKAVNDTHGHLVGDTVLRAVTDAISQHLRSYDLAGRFGGEEFVVLLPHAREADAISIAERLRRHVEAMVIPIAEDKPGEHVRLTISVGVATLDEHTRELTDLMAAADAAMYIAKQAGRNRTHAMGAIVTDPRGPEETPASPAVSTARHRLAGCHREPGSELAAAGPAVVAHVLSPSALGGVEVGTARLFIIGEKRGQARLFTTELPGDFPQHTALSVRQAHLCLLWRRGPYPLGSYRAGPPERSRTGLGIPADELGEHRSEATQFGEVGRR
jgi:diguanylate cyclase (GGDEF)-like protein